MDRLKQLGPLAANELHNVAASHCESMFDGIKVLRNFKLARLSSKLPIKHYYKPGMKTN